jgi:peptidoglycan/LPS O-acetylase OafA/YrhL
MARYKPVLSSYDWTCYGQESQQETDIILDSSKKMEIRKLNTLRGVAALIVVISHYSNETHILNGALGYGAGHFGVMIFFILSGFLMSYLYMGKKFNGNEVSKYAIARIARIVPLFLIVVLSSYLLQKIGFTGILYNISDKEALLSHLLLLSGTSVLWTIPAEMQFYILFVFLWWFWSVRKAQLFILISFILISLIFLDFLRVQGSVFDLAYDTALIMALPYLLIGIIFGQLYANWKVPDYLTSRIYLFSLLLIPLLYPKIFYYLFGYKHEFWKDVGIFFIVSFVFFSIIFLVPDDEKLISNRIGDFLGKISYSLYLLHIPVLWQLKTYAVSHPELFLPVFIILSIFISYLSYSVIENPLRLYIRSIAYKKSY